MRSFFYLPALAAVVTAQTATSTLPDDVNPTPDALDVDFFESLPNPTFTMIPGKLSQDVPYSPEEVLAAAASDIVENPLTVFPAATNVAMNADGEATVTPTPTAETESRRRRRGTPVLHELAKRKACDPEATISNYYEIDVSSYDVFVANTKIASIANAAPTPTGYFQNFKNAPGASRASAYLGYSVLKTGYDVAACAAKCTKKAGCVAFNIFFERDPVKTPGAACRNPDAFANIKCSLWGVPLDTTTADNKGQYRADFHVGIAGSNAYTSYTVGGPVEGYDAPPLSLGRLALNAPLRDCAGTWTYLGNRFYADQPFDPRVCATACEAITAYNAAHPPKSGKAPAKCAAFGTYLMKKTTPEGEVFVTGQQCTFYTKGWGAEYAWNKGGNKDKQGNVYTFTTSYFYSNPDLQPVCSAAVEERGLGLVRGQAWRK